VVKPEGGGGKYPVMLYMNMSKHAWASLKINNIGAATNARHGGENSINMAAAGVIGSALHVRIAI